MAHTLLVNVNDVPAYKICIEKDFDALPSCLSKLCLSGRRACIVTDENVNALYAEDIKRHCLGIFSDVTTYVFAAGEEYKNLTSVCGLYEHLIKHGFDRKDVLISLGGGVVGDMCGFAAATYLRGIRFIQIPTTLLSQVDSSIGGKTAVDFEKYKNMVGAFYMPSMVYISATSLLTLDETQFACGMGEVIKHGIIKDRAYFDMLCQNAVNIRRKDLAALEAVILGSDKIKKAVVEKDPKEEGERALLNFGHTIGHAIEKLADFRLGHGQCVALGMVASSKISMERGLISAADFTRIKETVSEFGLPVKLPDSEKHISRSDIVSATKHDKKMDGGKIKFVLIDAIGNAFVNKDVTDEELLAGISCLYSEE